VSHTTATEPEAKRHAVMPAQGMIRATYTGPVKRALAAER
jgi:hypothetical protein